MSSPDGLDLPIEAGRVRLRVFAPTTPGISANIVPAWVLPLMRLRRAGAAGNLAQAWARLPRTLPAGVAMPDEEEAAVMLLALRLV